MTPCPYLSNIYTHALMYSLFIIVVWSFLWIHLSSRLELSNWKVVVLMVFVSVRTSTTLPVCQQSQHATWPGFYRCVKLYTAAVGRWSEMKCVFFYSICSLFFLLWWKNSADSSVSGDTILLPLYTSSERVKLVTHVCFPCGSNPNRWIQSGAALFLKQQWQFITSSHGHTHGGFSQHDQLRSDSDHQMKFQLEQHGSPNKGGNVKFPPRQFNKSIQTNPAELLLFLQSLLVYSVHKCFWERWYVFLKGGGVVRVKEMGGGRRTAELWA